MRPNLIQARAIARDVEDGTITTADWKTRRDEIHAAFHKLDRSDPATAALRKEDMRLARVIWEFVGRLPADNVRLGGGEVGPERRLES